MEFDFRTIDEAASLFGPAWQIGQISPAQSRPYQAPDFLYGQEPDSLRPMLSMDLLRVACHRVRDVRIGAESTILKDNVAVFGVEIGLSREWTSSRIADRPVEKWFQPTQHCESAVLLTAPGHYIFGHWLTDFLPRLYVLHLVGLPIQSLTYLVPRDTPAFAVEVLMLLGVSPSNLVGYDRDNDVVSVSELLIPTDLRSHSRLHQLFGPAVKFLWDLLSRNRFPPPRSGRTDYSSHAVMLIRVGSFSIEMLSRR